MTNFDDQPNGVPVSGPEGAISAAKRSARAEARSAREALDSAGRTKASSEAAHNLLALPELQDATLLLTYSALPAEIDPLPAVCTLRDRGVRIAYPRIESPGSLGVYGVARESDLVPGPFGLAEPREGTPALEPDSIDAVIIPGIAFDRGGTRVGYGGGYYDRLLPHLRPDCVRIGLAFDEQVLSGLPAEPHDASVHLIVTQTRVIRTSAAPSPVTRKTPRR